MDKDLFSLPASADKNLLDFGELAMMKTAEAAHHDETRHALSSFRMIVQHFWQWRSSEVIPGEHWAPAINLYQLEDRLELCVDLAGIEPGSLEIRLEGDRLLLRGVRPAPDPRSHPQPMRIVTMEIDHGPFCRVIPLPVPVDTSRVSTRYQAGLLWISLPVLETNP